LAAQVLSRHGRHFAPLVPVHGCCGSLHFERCSGLNFYKTKHIGIPADQVNLSAATRRAVVPGHDRVTQLAQMEVGVFLAAPAGTLVRR
jgi:hypothetical protein